MTRICFMFSMLLFIGTSSLLAQVSPDCGNAIPICDDTPVNGGTNGYGVDDFNGSQKSGCLEETTTQFIEFNSAWYRFRTGASGQLGINIGINASEDWDFALYEADGCNDITEPIRCNFFDNRDKDSYIGFGEDPTGDTSNIQYEDWLEVTPGETYYLLINNFSNVNSGFSIQFSGNIFTTNPFDALDCTIVDNLLGPPISVCEGTNVTLNANISNAVSYSWFVDNGDGFQPIEGENSAVLVVSNSAVYQVQVSQPFGETTISDVQVGISPNPISFSLSNVAACSDETSIDLSLKDREVLNDQNTEDFAVSYHNTLADANSGSNAMPKLLPIPSSSQTIYVRVSSVKNTDCYDATEQFQLILLESPELDFPSEVFLCDGTTSVSIGPLLARPFHTYEWSTGETTSSIDVTQNGTYTVTVTNSQNGVSCPESKAISVVVSSPPVITDIEIEDLQEENIITVITEDTGNLEFQLDDGPYQSSPVFEGVLAGEHTISVNDKRGCGEVSEQIVVVGFPKFFTSNGDGTNDNWQVLGVTNLENPIVSIYDRFGKLLVQLAGNSQGWDGTLDGNLMPSADYWFKLTYTGENGLLNEAKYINNHFSLKR